MLNTDATIRNLILEGQFDKISALLEGGIDGSSYSFSKDIYRLIKEIAARSARRTACASHGENPQQLEMNLKGIFIKS